MENAEILMILTDDLKPFVGDKFFFEDELEELLKAGSTEINLTSGSPP